MAANQVEGRAGQGWACLIILARAKRGVLGEFPDDVGVSAPPVSDLGTPLASLNRGSTG